MESQIPNLNAKVCWISPYGDLKKANMLVEHSKGRSDVDFSRPCRVFSKLNLISTFVGKLEGICRVSKMKTDNVFVKGVSVRCREEQVIRRFYGVHDESQRNVQQAT